MQKFSTIYISIILILFFCGYYYFRPDDTYIFYKYAKNITEGNGYVFNFSEKINATTSPLYTIILALIYFLLSPVFNIDFAVIGNLISILSICLVLYSTKKILNDDHVFGFFPFIFLALPVIKSGFGMETFLNLAIITFTLYLYQAGRFSKSAFFAGLSILARYDSVLFVCVLFVHFIITKKRFPPFKVILNFLLIIVPWFAFSKLYFGDILPTTIEAKVIQQKIGIFGNGLIFLSNMPSAIPGSYFTLILLVPAIIFSLFYLVKFRGKIFRNTAVNLLLIWSALLFITYAFILNIPPYPWYYCMYCPAISVLLSITLAQILSSEKLKSVITTVLFFISIILPVKNIYDGYNEKYLNYISASNWLNNNAEQNSVVAVDEIGIIGFYYKNGRIIDALGLINPEVNKYLVENNFDWFLDYYKPEFVVNEFPDAQKYLAGTSDKFRHNYKAVKIIKSKNQQIAVYKRNKLN